MWTEKHNALLLLLGAQRLSTICMFTIDDMTSNDMLVKNQGT